MASWGTPVTHVTGDTLAVSDWNTIANNETFLYQTLISATGWVPLGGWANSWDSASGPGGLASYRVTGNIVRLGGAIASGAVGYPAFTLPPGARPSWGLSLSANMGNNGGSVYSAAVLAVSTGGVCTPYLASGTYFFLDGLTFTTD